MNDTKKFTVKKQTQKVRAKEGNDRFEIEVEETSGLEIKKDKDKPTKRVKIKIVKLKEDSKREKEFKDVTATEEEVTYREGHLFHYFETEKIGSHKLQKVEISTKGLWAGTTWRFWFEGVIVILAIIALIWWIVWGFGKKKGQEEDKDFQND